MKTSQASVLAVTEQSESPEPGDWIEVDATGAGSPRRGEILEVLGSDRHTHFRVRWDEEHISLFYPAERGFVAHPKHATHDPQPAPASSREETGVRDV